MICSLPLCGCQAEKQPAQAGDKGDQLRCIGNTSHSYPGMNNEASAYFIRLFSSSENTKITRMGWCPRTGKGQRLMFKEAVSEYIWLATCQGKIYENKPPSATHETI